MILEGLDALFLEDTTQTAYLAYQMFENFKRLSQMLMKDYLVNFEQLHTKIKDHQMILPDGALAYRVLNSANLATDQMILCLHNDSPQIQRDGQTIEDAFCGFNHIWAS